ncbi:hypothetical protein BH09BAC3_BH09BAC3_13900 [soil metagenome]
MESKKNSGKGRYAVAIGIAGGFMTLVILAAAIFDDNDAAEISSALAIFCSMLAIFLGSTAKNEPCTKTKTLNA